MHGLHVRCVCALQFQQAKLTALQAELEQRKRAIEVAQRDLNEAMEKYDYEVG